MTKNLRPFHLAFPAKDLEETRAWYTEILGCSVGRESSDWIDFNMFGHQVVAHLSSSLDSAEKIFTTLGGGTIEEPQEEPQEQLQEDRPLPLGIFLGLVEEALN